MDGKNTVEVVIDGEIVTLSGVESAEYIQRLALYIDRKIYELSGGKKFFGINSFMKTLLIAVNIADDLFKQTAKAETAENLLAERDEEIKRIKEANERVDIIMNENIRLKQRVKELQDSINQDINRGGNTFTDARQDTMAKPHIKLKRL
jgi:cell division protein ZapA